MGRHFLLSLEGTRLESRKGGNKNKGVISFPVKPTQRSQNLQVNQTCNSLVILTHSFIRSFMATVVWPEEINHVLWVCRQQPLYTLNTLDKASRRSFLSQHNLRMRAKMPDRVQLSLWSRNCIQSECDPKTLETNRVVDSNSTFEARSPVICNLISFRLSFEKCINLTLKLNQKILASNDNIVWVVIEGVTQIARKVIVSTTLRIDFSLCASLFPKTCPWVYDKM